jgi:flagellar motor switch protein FliN/FliY
VNSANDILHWLIEEFSSRLAIVFETMSGERPAIEIEHLSTAPADATLRWRQAFSGVAGAAWVAAPESGWSAAGGHVLRAAGIEESDPGSLKSTYLETISQALSGMAGAMGGRVGHEVSCSGGEESSVWPAADANWAVLHIHLGTETANVAIGLENALVAVLVASSRLASEQPSASAGAPERIVEAAAAATAGGFSIPANSKTFELLLDVELPVSVSFGRAQVPLKDVLKLTTGSIVELNRSILEPVEVIVNNCVIARGEVVVVEGNFGVRVQQVISRQERLRTLN